MKTEQQRAYTTLLTNEAGLAHRMRNGIATDLKMQALNAFNRLVTDRQTNENVCYQTLLDIQAKAYGLADSGLQPSEMWWALADLTITLTEAAEQYVKYRNTLAPVTPLEDVDFTDFSYCAQE